MTLKSIVLHLGAHKTGTSLVQKFTRDKKKLCEANNIFVLPRGEATKLLGWGSKTAMASGREALLARISSHSQKDCFLISHENAIGRPFIAEMQGIYPNAKACAARLREELAGHAFRVIYYIRSQPEFLESYYLQLIHQGEHFQFREWKAKMEPPSLSWRPIYNALCDAFGRENVVLRDFGSEIKKGQAEYLQRFFESFMAVDLRKWKDFEYEQVHNPSIGKKGLAIGLAINRLTDTPEERRAVRKFLQVNFSNRDYPRPTLLEEKEKQALREKYGAENEALIKESTASSGAPL